MDFLSILVNIPEEGGLEGEDVSNFKFSEHLDAGCTALRLFACESAVFKPNHAVRSFGTNIGIYPDLFRGLEASVAIEEAKQSR